MARRPKSRKTRASSTSRQASHSEEQRIWDHELNDAFIVRLDGNRWRAVSAADQIGVPAQFSSRARDRDGGGLAYFGATAREAVERLEQGKGRKLHPYSFIDREAVEKDVQIVLPPAVIESDAEAEEWLRKSPREGYTGNSRSLSRDEYWSILLREERKLPANATYIQARARGTGLVDQGALTILDILRYTNGFPEVNMKEMPVPSGWTAKDLPLLLEELAGNSLGYDLLQAYNLGRIPATAPHESHRLTEDEYWDACRDIAKYVAHRDPGPGKGRYMAVKIKVELHPFSNWQQYQADVLGWTQHLHNLIPVENAEEVLNDWDHASGAREALGRVAEGCMFSDIWAMSTSRYGLGYIPNPNEVL